LGSEIDSHRFLSGDFKEFQDKLHEETESLRSLLEHGESESQGEVSGLELEAWLVDQNFLPCPVNESFLKLMDSPQMVSELSRFNIEFNSQPHALKDGFFASLEKEVGNALQAGNLCASHLGSQILLIGILPTLRESMLSLENMSPLLRYRALNEQVQRLRGGRPFCLDIQGQEHLTLKHENVMLEAAATSLQIHLQIPAERALRFFNAALLVSAPMVGIAANSPFLFGRELWSETRIPLFEQSVDLPATQEPAQTEFGRVSFGSGYLKKSWIELFEENLRRFPVLLPLSEHAGPEELPHLRMHNGTIWRWNRPIISFDEEHRLALRIEHRVASAGPSLVDVLGNCAFFLGLIHHLGNSQDPPEAEMDFSKARENFYEAARHGLDAKLHWGRRSSIPLQKLLEEELLGRAEEGLRSLSIPEEEIEHYLWDTVGQRVRKGQNGAVWQKRFVDHYGKDFPAMIQRYAEWQGTQNPVHSWSL